MGGVGLLALVVAEEVDRGAGVTAGASGGRCRCRWIDDRSTRSSGKSIIGWLSIADTVNILGGTLKVRGNLFGNTDIEEGGTLTGSAEDLLGQIMAAPLIRCDEVAWSLMGLSMASWNALLSFALAAIWIAAARRR